uniref:Uncharacterized protein n=1 Tax=Glossina pallidipes TaxID=7398 RepID=A0A1B0A372_GLOPL
MALVGLLGSARYVLDITMRHKKSPAQILLRFQIQLGNAAMSKSGICENMQNNFNIFEFELRPKDIQNFNSLTYGMRLFKFSGKGGKNDTSITPKGQPTIVEQFTSYCLLIITVVNVYLWKQSRYSKFYIFYHLIALALELLQS